MYEVKIINGDEETIINAASTRIEAPRVTGSIKLAINKIDSFTFTILPNNKGYNKIFPFKTLVTIYDKIKKRNVFTGRVLLPVANMDKSGLHSKSFICESELAYLEDSYTRQGEYHNKSVREFLTILINNHNANVSAEKHFTLGNIDVEANLYRFTKYEDSTLASIKDNLLDRLGGELQVRYESGVRYLDYLNSIGSNKDTIIRISKNLQTLEQEKDPTQVITRLAPFGSKLEDSEERLSIKSINNNKDYIDDIEAQKEFGIIQKNKTWDDVTIAENLLRKANEFLASNNKILKKYKIDALDLSLIKLETDSFEVGCSYRVINPLMNIDEYLKVIEKTIDISNPQNSSLMVGDKFEDIKDYQLNINRTSKRLDNVADIVNSTIQTVGNVNNELDSTVKVVNNTIEVLSNTNATVADLNEQLINISKSLQDNINATVQLTNTTNLITEKLNTTNTKLESLKKRVAMEV